MLEQTLIDLTAAIQQLTQVLAARDLQGAVPYVIDIDQPKSLAPEKPIAKPTPEKPAAKPAAKPAPAPEKPTPTPAVTPEMVRAALLQLIDVQGKEAAGAIFKAEGIERGSQLKPERYAAVYAQVQQLLQGA